MNQDQTPPANADKGQTNPPVSSGAGQGSPSTEAPYNLPEKFQGKTPADIAKAYDELEKKLGEQSRTVEEARALQEQTDTLVKAIYSDPDLYRKVEQGVKRYTSGETLPDERSNPADKGDEARKSPKVDPIISDLKLVEENRIINKFMSDYGYTGLDEKTRKDSYAKLATTLAEIVDPGGKRPMQEVLSSIPLPKLGKYLENAHFIANKEAIIAHERQAAMLRGEENKSGAIGSFAAASPARGQGITLTNQERDIARKMGISEEKYLSKKLQMSKEAEE